MMSNTTNACIQSTYKFITPSTAAPSTIGILKYLTVNRVCTAVVAMNAGCNPGVAASTATVGATATAAQIGMAPTCQWACAGCTNITTSAATDGLPVELMDFSIEDSEAWLDSETDEVSGEQPARK